MMDIHESTQEFRHLATKSTAPTVSDDEEEMVLNYSDSEDDHSSKVSRSENLKENMDLLDKDHRMEITDDDSTDKQVNGVAATGTIDETDSREKGIDDNALIKSEKISLLDRFLSSEVVENGKENITELIGDELVDEIANEVIDANALLDEITNDLDQDELDDELDDEIMKIEGTKQETETSKEVAIKSTLADESNEETAETVTDEANETAIANVDETPEVRQMEVDDQELDEVDPKSELPEVSSEKEAEETGITDLQIDEKTTEAPVDDSSCTTKVDEDNDNNLLEEMLDSPRSSENGSIASEMLEKDDTVTRDSNEDEKPDRLIVQSSNENSNMSESGVTVVRSDVVGEFKHDGEIHIMDDAGISLESSTAAIDDMMKEAKVEMDLDVKTETNGEEMTLKEEVKAEGVSPDELVDQTSCDNSEKPVEEVVTHATQSPEPPCKRKSDEEISEPENKKKRLDDEDPSNADTVVSSENAVSADNDIDIADINEDTGVDEDTQTENTNKDDDDDVLIVGEMNQTKKSPTEATTTATVQEPVQKAKILILDTQAIAGDLCDDLGDKTNDRESAAEGSTIPETESPVSSSQDEPIVEKVAESAVETTEKPTEKRARSPATLTLDPVPQKSLFPSAFSLNFVRKFQKNFDKMNRNDLEELLIQKCVEVIVHKSDYAEMRSKIEKQESKLQSYSTKFQELSKQYRDLEIVHQRVIKDLEAKNQSIVTPVKIIRAVGLQVSLPRKEIAVQKAPPTQPSVASGPSSVNAMHNIALQNAAMARNRRKVPPQRPNDANVSPQQQQQQQHLQQQQLMRQNMMLSRRPEIQMQQRNQVHLQQQHGQNNLLKQQLIQNNNPSNLRQPANVRKPVFSPTAANQQQNTSPKTPASAERQRVPPVILKKMTPTRMVTVNNPASNAAAGAYSGQSKIANTSISRSSSTSMNNLIDLTDEEDSRRIAQNGTNPPALVAIPNNHGNKTVVAQGKVNFLTVKPGTPQAQLQMAHQNRLAAMQKAGGAYVPIAPKSNGTTGQVVQLRQKQQQQPATTLTPVQRRQHPAPLPYPNNQPTNPYWRLIPPRPIIRINNIEAGIVISWTMDEMTDKHAEVASYQIYAYQETSAAPSPETWRHVGDVKAMLLPMAVTLTQFQEGQRYHFAVRAVDEHSRYGIFSLPKTWT